MMAGNPSNWWNMLPPSSQFVVESSSSSSLPLSSMADHNHHHHQPPNSQSWSQLLLGGLQEGDEDGSALNNNINNHFEPKMLENLEGRVLIPFQRFGVGDHMMMKQLACSQSSKSLSMSFLWNNEESASSSAKLLSSQVKAAASSSSSSPKANSVNSCLTSNAILDFSFNKVDSQNQIHDHSYLSECASTAATGGVCKKARVQPLSGQPPIKVRKEKVGDRITALHQLVSPFGKTDTASVLSEAIGYVRFLQSQIEALISPYLGNNSSKSTKKEQLVFNDNNLKRKLPHYQENEEEAKDLRSRGLCLIPVSCTQHVQSDINGADYWAQAYNGSF